MIYLTAYSEDATLNRARSTTPYGYLLKPFAAREMHATIQMALARRDSDRAIRENEERLLLALDAADMGSWEWNANSTPILPHGQPDRFLGLRHEVFSCSVGEFLELVHEADRALVRC